MVTTALAKQHLRVDTSDEDTLIDQYIAAAQAWVENYTDRLLEVGEVVAEFPEFANPLLLKTGPVVSLTSVEYLDADNVSQTVAGARLVRGKVYPAVDASWPTTGDPSGVTVTYQAGYTTVPADLISAQLLLVGHWFENREAASERPAQEIALAVEALCRPYRGLSV